MILSQDLDLRKVRARFRSKSAKTLKPSAREATPAAAAAKMPRVFKYGTTAVEALRKASLEILNSARKVAGSGRAGRWRTRVRKA